MKMLESKGDEVNRGCRVLLNEEHNYLHRTYRIVKIGII
jgi:hypothetical protein